MHYKKLTYNQIDLFLMIDRSEVIDWIYYQRDGVLVLEAEHYDMLGFPPGEQLALLKRQKKLHQAGGIIIGAFDGEQLVGIVSIENVLRGPENEYAKMDILFVTKSHRGRGIAKALVEEAVKAGVTLGAKKLYISATPSERTVNFYLKAGCKLLTTPDPELFAMEPEDIHMGLDILRQ
jgi:GNAT superfamily N-acetyltransferase